MRIDSHVHAFPERLALAVRSHFSRNGNGTLTDGPLLDDVAHRVRARGFDAAWILPYAHRPGVAESVNEWSAAEVTRYPWLVAGATFHPGDDELARLVERSLVELRLRVVKLHCAVGQFSPADARLVPLWKTAAECGAPVVIHAGQRSGGATESDEVEELIPVLAAHPDLRIVLAHSGYPAVETTLGLMERFDNLYGDLTPVWLNHVPVTAGDLRRFPGRFLFGSDAPNSPLTPADHESCLAALALTPGERELLLGGAALNLVPLAPPSAK
jgi:predicted TIM-barrel fold metal-dependent hydrolase